MKFIPPVETRYQLGDIAEAEGLTSMIEIGVQSGVFSSLILARWPRFERYYGIDPWAHQENYVDGANVQQYDQDRSLASSLSPVSPFHLRPSPCATSVRATTFSTFPHASPAVDGPGQ